jgi:hypothetical protein
MGIGTLIARPEPGDASVGYCSYVVGDRAVAATSFLAVGGRGVLDIYEGQAESVPGLADQAIWVEDIHTLYIRKGDSVFSIQLLPTIVPPDEIKAKTVTVGRAAAGRLT